MLEFALSQETARTAPSPGGGPGGESCVSFYSVPTFSKKEEFPFPPGSQVHGTTVCDALLPHSRPRPIFASSQDITVRGRCTSPRTSGQSHLGSREFGEDASECTVFCTIHPYSLSLHHHRYIDCTVGAACTASGAPSLSRWLTRTIRLSYAIQFARRPSKFNSVLEMSCQSGMPLSCMRRLLSSWQRMQSRQGFHSPYFIVPKKGGQQPILDRRVLNRALHKLPFHMLMRRCIIKCIQPQDWFVAIDQKDAYIHVSILL